MKAKNLPLKALLILDNAPSHPSAEELVKDTADGKIWVLNMPPNVTPLIQPMDQNAIRLLKLHYKNSLLSRIVASKEPDIAVFFKSFTLYDAVTAIDLGWKSISEESLAKCWNKLFPKNKEFEEEDDIPLSSLLQRDEDTLAMRSGIQFLNIVFPSVSHGSHPHMYFLFLDFFLFKFFQINFSVSDLNEWVERREDHFIDNDDDEDQTDEEIEIQTEPKVKHDDAIKSFELCIQWAKQNNVDHMKLAVLAELQENAVKTSLSIPKKQTLINTFFN